MGRRFPCMRDSQFSPACAGSNSCSPSGCPPMVTLDEDTESPPTRRAVRAGDGKVEVIIGSERQSFIIVLVSIGVSSGVGGFPYTSAQQKGGTARCVVLRFVKQRRMRSVVRFARFISLVKWRQAHDIGTSPTTPRPIVVARECSRPRNHGGQMKIIQRTRKPLHSLAFLYIFGLVRVVAQALQKVFSL